MSEYSRFFFVGLILIFGSVQSNEAMEVAIPVLAPLSDVVETVIEDLSRSGVLGSAMAIKLPGRAPLLLSSGYVDVVREQAMEPMRLFQIGSQTKMFTAAAILLLAREGKLSLNDPVAGYVKGVTGSPDVTIGQLMTHTGGIGDSVVLFDPPALRPDYTISLADHLLLSQVVGRQFEAGTDWAYNNLGSIILGNIVELVSGQPLNIFMRDWLFRPLGMQNTWLGALESYPEESMAHGYFTSQKDGEVLDSTKPDLSWASSAGDMLSNLEDMLIWADSLLKLNSPLGLALDDFRMVLVATGSEGNMKEYGLGFMGWNLNGRVLWGHGGDIHGYVSMKLIDPQSGIVIALMINLVEDSDDLVPTLNLVLSV